MTKTSTTSALVAGVFIVGLFAAQDFTKAGDKVEICHFPPGNPANFHTIVVGIDAVEKHLQNHGDAVGPCCGLDDLCDDGDACTANFCLDGQCSSELVDCSDGVECTDDFCDAVEGCFSLPNDTNCARGETCDPDDGCGISAECVTDEDCDDGNLCNGDDFCFDGVCFHGGVTACQAGTACEPETGLCVGTQGPCEVDADCVCRCENGGCTPTLPPFGCL